ncbi:MAG: hypothetical protein EOP19_10450 [Hyphomicrobiales bacterium]|nr:MAG: hypothetical protein EOP19_10450 [Hyphomicrobiales bacterium]
MNGFIPLPTPILPDLSDDLAGPEAVAAFLRWPVAKAARALELSLTPPRIVNGVQTARRSRLRAIFGNTCARAA